MSWKLIRLVGNHQRIILLPRRWRFLRLNVLLFLLGYLILQLHAQLVRNAFLDDLGHAKALFIRVDLDRLECLALILDLGLQVAHLLCVVRYLELDHVERSLVFPHEHEVIEVLDHEVEDVLEYLWVVKDCVFILLPTLNLDGHQVAI